MNDFNSIIAEIQNHVQTINGELGDIKIQVAILQTQMGEIIWWFKAFAVSIITLLVTQGWQIITMRRNNKNKEQK